MASAWRRSLVLSPFGVGGVAGNLIGARLADRALMPTIGGVLAYSVLLLGGVVALGPALQIRLMGVAGDVQAVAAALNHSAFNFANALGAGLGGLAIAADWG